jgi:nucleoside-triphosphatase
VWVLLRSTHAVSHHSPLQSSGEFPSLSPDEKQADVAWHPGRKVERDGSRSTSDRVAKTRQRLSNGPQGVLRHPVHRMCRPDPHILLLTGTPGIGKTTVIRRAADRLGDKGLRGFYTEEVREKGERRGFRLVSFDGTTHIIAHVEFPKTHRVGKYGVDIEALDNAAALLRSDAKARLYLVDEIGKMECLSERFVAAMRVLISSVIPIVATVGVRGGGFIAEVKRMPARELWQVTHANRDDLPARILTWLAERIQPDC